jgi:hypothetical protein
MDRLTSAHCDAIFQSLTVEKKRALVNIILEHDRAAAKHPSWPVCTDKKPNDCRQDYIYAAAIINEEAGELIRAAIQYEHEGGKYIEMHKEGIQVGAMALRFLVNLPETKEVSHG